MLGIQPRGRPAGRVRGACSAFSVAQIRRAPLPSAPRQLRGTPTGRRSFVGPYETQRPDDSSSRWRLDSREHRAAIAGERHRAAFPSRNRPRCCWGVSTSLAALFWAIQVGVVIFFLPVIAMIRCSTWLSGLTEYRRSDKSKPSTPATYP